MSIESITATIPVKGIQYCDLRPTISADNIEEYKAQLAEVGRLAGNVEFAERMSGGSDGTTTPKQLLQFKDTKVKFDPVAHEYDGYVSGSKFADMFVEEFKKDFIAGKIADKCTNLDASDVLKLWDTKGEVSRSFGTAVHAAIENRFRFDPWKNQLGGMEKIMSNVPYINDIVDMVWDTVKLTEDQEPMPEFFVANDEDKVCGFIDLLVCDKKNKTCHIYDWKTNNEFKEIKWVDGSPYAKLEPNMLSVYKLQLSLYAHCLKKAGYKVDACTIVQIMDGDVKPYDFAPLSIEKGLEWIR